MKMTELVMQRPPLFSELPELVDRAIWLLRELEPPNGYWLAFSGGVDSCVILDLANVAGVKYTAYYSFVPIDPPELRAFIHREYPQVIVIKPKMSLLQLCAKAKIMPTRNRRWCCDHYKHSGKDKKLRTILGVRAEESPRRAREWSEFPFCNKYKRDTVLPIFQWSREDEWIYVAQRGIVYSPLYDEGFKRLGCVLCPFTSKYERKREIERWPGIMKLWRKAAEIAYAQQGTAKVFKFDNAQEYFDWWISGISIREWCAKTGKPIPAIADEEYDGDLFDNLP